MKRAFIQFLKLSIAVPLLIVVIIVIYAGIKPKLTEESRKNGIGSYVELSRGIVHYELNRTETVSPVVVLIHGITVPLVVWDKTVPALNSAGITTLRMDLYGRGFSDRPIAKYSSQLYIQQITELMDSLNITEPVHLIGISMGGAVAAHLASDNPERIASVQLIDPAVSYRAEEGPGYLWEQFRENRAKAALPDSLQPDREHLKEFEPHIKEQFSYRGIEFSLLSMALYGKSEEVIKAYRALAATHLPVQIIWGEDDRVLPLNLGRRLAREFDSIPFEIIPNAGHTPHYEAPHKVNPLLVNYILSQYTEINGE